MALYTSDGKINYAEIKMRAERYDAMRMKRAREACRLAGLDPSIIGVHVHNALVGLHYGEPWRNVNYHYARKSRWLMDTCHEASRCIDRLYRRKGCDAFAFNQSTTERAA